MHFRIKNKRDKIRFVPIHPAVLRLIADYLEIGKHGAMAISRAQSVLQNACVRASHARASSEFYLRWLGTPGR